MFCKNVKTKFRKLWKLPLFFIFFSLCYRAYRKSPPIFNLRFKSILPILPTLTISPIFHFAHADWKFYQRCGIKLNPYHHRSSSTHISNDILTEVLAWFYYRSIDFQPQLSSRPEFIITKQGFTIGESLEQIKSNDIFEKLACSR